MAFIIIFVYIHIYIYVNICQIPKGRHYFSNHVIIFWAWTNTSDFIVYSFFTRPEYGYNCVWPAYGFAYQQAQCWIKRSLLCLPLFPVIIIIFITFSYITSIKTVRNTFSHSTWVLITWTTGNRTTLPKLYIILASYRKYPDSCSYIRR